MAEILKDTLALALGITLASVFSVHVFHMHYLDEAIAGGFACCVYAAVRIWWHRMGMD